MKNSWRFIKEALSSLAGNKLRTGLTMLGIVIGVAAVISLMSVGEGAQASITDSIQAMGTNSLYISRDTSVTNSMALTLADAQAIASADAAPSVLAVAPSVQRSMDVSYAGESLSTTIVGVTPQYELVRNEQVASGRFITQEDMDTYATVAVIGGDVVEDVFGGQANVIGEKLRIGSNLYQVVGVLESKGGTSFGSSDSQVFVPLTTAQVRIITATKTYGEVNMITVQSVNADVVDAAINEITSILRYRHDIAAGEDADFSVFSQESFTEAANEITGVMTLFLGGIAAISLLVGGIGIMNIMLVSVIERTKEIGLRKAVGARDSDIMLQFLVESLIIGLFGGLIGIIFGWGISRIITTIAASGSTPLTAQISADSVLLAVGFSVAVGLLFGLYPANRAAKLEPVEALRTE